MAPHHYDRDQDLIKLSVHSWLLKIAGKTILIDCCCGNNRRRPARPFWDMLNTPYLERLAAAGARPQDIDYVMCTHLHHDHVGWNTQLRERLLGADLSRMPANVISKPDFEYYQSSMRTRTRPSRWSSHIPRLRAARSWRAGRADLVTGPHRLNEFLESCRRPVHSAGHVVFKLDSGRRTGRLHR